MSRITSSDNDFHGKYGKFFIDLYNRNKNLLRVSTVIFFVSLFIGVFIGYFSPNITSYLLTKLIQLIESQVVSITTLSIFIHNVQAGLVAYFGGIIAIGPPVELFSNGFIYGSFVGYFMHGGILSNYGVSNPVYFIIYTLPHGIFEIPAFIISCTAGFRLTSMIIHILISLSKNKPVSENYWEFKDSLTLMVIAIALFFVAAIIEANFSLTIGNYITGLNLHNAVVQHY